MVVADEAPPTFAAGLVLGAVGFVFGAGLALRLLDLNLPLGLAVLAGGLAVVSRYVYSRPGERFCRGLLWGAGSGALALAFLLFQLLSRVE